MSDELSVLPPDAVLVHIGPHKTGTTAIQTTLGTVRPLLRAHAVEYPGGPRTFHHGNAIRALRQIPHGWSNDAEPPPEPRVWQDVVDQVRAAPGRVIVSSEFLSQADPKTRATLVREFGRDRVHILIAARNPAAIALSMWQQVLRKGHPTSLESWLERYYRRTEMPERPTGLWAHIDAATLVEQWAEVVDRDRITVVVLDESDRRQLATTIERLLGLPAGLLADHAPLHTNRGLTALEAALVRDIIAATQSRLTWVEHTRYLRTGLTLRLLKVRQPGPEEPRSALPEWAAHQAAFEAERMIAALTKSGAHVVGNLDSLRSLTVPVGDNPPITDVPMELAVEAAVGAIAAGTRNHWSLDHPRPKAKKPPSSIDAIPTPELVAILGRRVRKGLRRRLHLLRS